VTLKHAILIVVVWAIALHMLERVAAGVLQCAAAQTCPNQNKD